MNPDWTATIPDAYTTDLKRQDHASNVRNFYRNQGAEAERFKLLAMVADIDPEVAKQMMSRIENQ